MTTGLLHDQNLEKRIEKQMGCMTGFLQLFDRHQILTGKNLYTTRRLPHYPTSECSSQSERSVESSPVYSRELRHHHHQHQQQQQQQQQQEKTKQNHRTSCSPTPEIPSSPAPGNLQSPETPARTPMHLPVFEFKEGLRSSWKFKEAPRLSLDSRATVDGKGKLYPKENRTIAAKVENGKQQRSPSVIGKLMGLETLPESGREPVQKAELRRSASESRVSRDLKFMDGNNYRTNSGYVRENAVFEAQVKRSKGRTSLDLNRKSETQNVNGGLVAPSLKSHHQHHRQQHQQQRKSYFDVQDVFPDPKQPGYLYGEIEKRLKLRGIDEPAQDLETLKEILEALQLKGLLHSNTREAEHSRNRSRSNIIFDRRFEESPIVVIKPSRSVPMRRAAPDSPSNLRSKPFGLPKNFNIVSEHEQSIRPRREQMEIDRKVPNQRRNHPNESFGNSPRRRQNNNIDNLNHRRTTNDSMEQRKNATGYSPKTGTKNQITSSKSPRNRRSPVETSQISTNENESCTISEISRTERMTKVEDYKEGMSLLARCDKLLNSIAEITAVSGSELQPSPVSVLDSSSLYYKDESSPSPVMKRSIDFKDRSEELEEDNWSPAISPVRLKFNEKSDDCDFLYVSEILRASNSLSEDTDIFLLLEKHQYKTSNSSDPYSKLHRKLVFDTVTELLQKKKQLPPWKAISAVTITGKPCLQQIWSEFLRIKERDPAEDLFEVICGVLRKDMAGDAVNEWCECQMETSEAVLDIERMIFKDLIGETIRDLASFASNSRVSRRKLVF